MSRPTAGVRRAGGHAWGRLGAALALASAAALGGASCAIRFFPLPTLCDETPLLADGDVVTGETSGPRSRASPQPDTAGDCTPGMGAPEEIFTLELDDDSSVHLDTFGSDYDTLLYVRSACESVDLADQVACNDDADVGGALQLWSALDVTLERGTYFVFVDGFNGDRGNFTLNVSLGPPNRPDGDQCSSADDAIDGDNLSATADFVDDTAASCGGDGGADAYWTLVLLNDSQVVVETVDAAFDTVLSVRFACLQSNSEIACDDDGNAALGAGWSRLDLGILAAGTYTIVVDAAVPGASGAYTLRVAVN